MKFRTKHDAAGGRASSRRSWAQSMAQELPKHRPFLADPLPPLSLVAELGPDAWPLPIDANADATGPPIPDIVVRRLPLYVRALAGLRRDGVAFVSSEDLAHRVGVTAAQLRRDLSYFGKFGKQGKGYDTASLEATIVRILKLDRQWAVALAGFGNLGQAVVRYRGFRPAFRIAAIFDPHANGDSFAGVPILRPERITDEVRRLAVRIGIIATPAAAAQVVADRMVAGGVRALLNYSPAVVRVPAGVAVREIDPVAAMQSLTFYLDDPDGEP